MVQGAAGPSDFILYRTATALNVRDMLQIVRARLEARGIESDICSRIELAVAEALNNVVEHAYAGAEPGPMRLALRAQRAGLCVDLADTGVPLPGLALPHGALPEHRVAQPLLPEGGYGWFLLHELTDRITYQRDGRWNRLTLEFDLDPA